VTKVLIVDDEPGLRRALGIALHARRYVVHTADTGVDALTQAASVRPDVVVLDLGLPDMDGTEVVRRLRSWSDVPILVLSGRTDTTDKVEALDAGADDYVTKPFSADELLARLRVKGRRAAPNDEAPVVRFGDVEVDIPAVQVLRAGEPIHLTPTEWHLLEVFVRNPGRLLGRKHLLAEVWGPGYENAQGNLRLYVAQLRQKIEPDPARPRYILTEPGMGYRFSPAPAGT
jgi:two-component system KDP operon response regulator KdpE